jgi:hypothetical protein
MEDACGMDDVERGGFERRLLQIGLHEMDARRLRARVLVPESLPVLKAGTEIDGDHFQT